MADEEVISDTERLRIAQHFLSQSPPGQFSEVLNGERDMLKICMYLHTLGSRACPHTDDLYAADVVRLIDLKQLLPTGLLSDKLVAEVLKTYHSSNGKIVSDGNNKVRRSACWHVSMHASLSDI